MARSRPLRFLMIFALALSCAVALSACGGDTKHNLRADNEGVYVDIGQLKYQVQLSRELNPFDNEDSSYLAGLAPRLKALTPAESWFGVFLLVVNKSGQARPAAGNFFISDTQGKVYHPTAPSADNAFAYRQATVPAHDQIPTQGSAAANGPTQGAVQLYKLPLTSFDNRPLILHIIGSAGDRAQVQLDV
ncbi:MAG: hypothetical protein ACR2ND_09690 [Solirubrobacteraceae bacterium]